MPKASRNSQRVLQHPHLASVHVIGAPGVIRVFRRAVYLFAPGYSAIAAEVAH